MNGSSGEATPRKTPPVSTSPRSSQDIGLSPLDYMKNKIVEVMRTTSEETPDSSRTGSSAQAQAQPSSSQNDDDCRDPTKFRGQPGFEVPCTSDVTEGGLPETANLSMGQMMPYPSNPSYPQDARSKQGNSEVSASSERCDAPATNNRVRARSISPSSSDNVQIGSNYPSKRMRMSNNYVAESSTERSNRTLPESSEMNNMSSSDRLCSSSDPSGNNCVTEGPSNADDVNLVSGSISSLSGDNFPQPSHQREIDGPESSTSVAGDGEVTSGGKAKNDSNEASHMMADSPESGNMIIDESPNVDSASSSKLVPISPPQVQEGISTSYQLGMPSSSSSGLHEVGPQNGQVSSSHSHSSPRIRISSPVTSSSVDNSSPSGSFTPSSSLASGVNAAAGISTTYSYPYNALSVRSMSRPNSSNSPASSSSPPSNAPQSSAISGSSPHQSSSQSSTVSGNVSRPQSSHVSGSSPCNPSSGQGDDDPPMIMSSQYEPLSDED